jgi:hypothetical protein
MLAKHRWVGSREATNKRQNSKILTTIREVLGKQRTYLQANFTLLDNSRLLGQAVRRFSHHQVGIGDATRSNT